MAKFLFTTLPTNDLGLLTRSLPIARELKAGGHEIIFCSPAPAPRQLIADAGFENRMPRHPLYEFIAQGRSFRHLARLIVSRRWRRYGSLSSFFRQFIRALPIKSVPDTMEIWNTDHAGALMGLLNDGFVRANCEALRELIEECEPDLVVDFWNPFAVIAARALHKPVVTVIQADAHPASQGFIWWKTPPEKIPTPAPVVNKILADYILPPLHTLSELNVGDLTLVVGMPETDPLPPGTDVHYVGPILWQQEAAKLPDWITDLNGEYPLVWIYSGNPRYGNSGKALDSMVVLQACIAALAEEHINVVLTTGYHSLPKEVQPLPSNFRHAPYLPGLAMAERSDLLIHHGGYGSCQTGLYVGKPAVIIPTFSERESNARRVAAAGAGAFMQVQTSPQGDKYINIRELRATILQVLSDPSYLRNARRMSQLLHSYGGASQAAQLIHQFCQQSP
jgi:UDP:flavonoid glycosyltransferase YjiC (YdhE family)